MLGRYRVDDSYARQALRDTQQELNSARDRLRAVESQLSTDQRAVSRTENQFRDQLHERNTLLLTVYQAVDKVAGADKVGFPCRLFLVPTLTLNELPRSERRPHRNRRNRLRISPSFTTASSSGSRASTNCTCRSSAVPKSSRSALSTSCSESACAVFLLRWKSDCMQNACQNPQAAAREPELAD